MIALHAGRNIITDFPSGVNINTWDLSDPNMMYLREHLQQIVVTIDDNTKVIIKSTGAPWIVTHITYSTRCECPGLLDLELPIYPGFNEYVWPINESLTGLEFTDIVTNVSGNCLIGIFNHSTNKSLTYVYGQWVGNLLNQPISLGDNIRLIGASGANPYECAVNLREYNPTVNETVEQCLSDSYWCRHIVDTTGVCPSEGSGIGCVETIQEQSIDAADASVENFVFPDNAQKVEFFMDVDTYPFIVELYENTQGLTTYLRGTMAYSGTTIGACGSCGSLNMGNIGFDNRAHCCANRHGGNRHLYTTTDNNSCDEEVWPAGDLAEGYNCYYPILPPDSEYCGDAICHTNQQCVQSYDVDGNLQSGCVDEGVQPFTDFMVFGRFVYNPDTGIISEVVNAQGGISDYEEPISNYGNEFINVCREFPPIDQPPIEEGSPDSQGIIALQNPTFVWTQFYGDGTSTDLVVYDCLSNSGHTTYRDGQGGGGVDGAFGCPNPTACNYNPDALMDGPESMCATLPPDCNGNCEKDIYGNPNPLFGFEIDACGLCSTTDAALESPVRYNYWVDECGKCTANRKIEIARSIGQKNMQYPDPNGNIYSTFLDERVYEGTQWFYTLEPDYGNSDLYSSAFIATGDSVCAQSNHHFYHEQCVGVELQLQNGDWVLFNEFPDTGEMMSRSTLYNIPLGWGDDNIYESCPGTIDFDTYDECMRNNSVAYATDSDDGPGPENIAAWNNTCCDESCTMHCMSYDAPPHWNNTSFNEYTQQHFNLTGGSTPYLSNGCDINWAALLNADSNNQIVSWNNTNYNESLYGDINGIPVKSIRAVCGELPRLPLSNSTIQNIMYTRESRPATYFIKRLSDHIVSNDYDFYNLHSEFQESMFAIIEDDLYYPGSYNGNGPGKETHIPFVHIDKTEYSQQITKIINPSTGDYVHISEDNNLITHDNQIITPSNELDLVPWLFSNGQVYHIEVTRNEDGVSFAYGNNSNNSLHIGIFGPPQILNSATNTYHKDTFGKLYCCEDSSPQNGLCDLPFNYATYCQDDVGGFFNDSALAQHTFANSCEEGQGNFIDVYEGVAGDMFGCMDPMAINYDVIATFPEDLSPCEYAKPLQVMNGQYTSYVVDHNIEENVSNTDAGRLYMRNVSEDTGAILGDFRIVDLNYGVHQQIFNLNQLTTDVFQFEVYLNNTTGNYDFGIMKTFKLSDPAIQPESYTESVYHQGRYYEAMIYTVKYEVEFEKDVFGDYTQSVSGNGHFRFKHPLYDFNTHVGIEFIVSSVDDNPTPIQYTPNMIPNSDCAAPGYTSWDIWNNTDCDSNWDWYIENLLPPGTSNNDEFSEENFVANQKHSMKSTHGSDKVDITHAKVYKRTNSVKIPYNTQNIGIGSNANYGSIQYWQSVNLPAGEYMISGWVKYVRGKILYTQYSNGDPLNGTETTDDLIPKYNGSGSLLRLHMHTNSWPWANVHNIDLSDSIVASKEDGGWKYFETSFTYNDEHFKTSRIHMNDYSAVNDIFNPYYSWSKRCSMSANPCDYPSTPDGLRGKKRNQMIWDGVYWNKVTGERSPLRIGFRSAGSMSQENPMVFGIYGLQLNRMDDYETTRRGNTKKFLKKSGNKIMLPANPYNSNEDTGLQNPNVCDTSRLVKMTTAIDTGTSVTKTEEGLHDFKFDVVNELDGLGELNSYEWQGANEVQMSLPTGGDFYVEYLGNGWELECVGAPGDSTLSGEIDENEGEN